jgi:hypothetical protein
MTTDADICPARERDDLERLARALAELRARIRTPGVPEGLAFACDATFLSRIEVALNLTTKFGDLDLSFIPSGTRGFADLHQHAVPMSLMGRPVAVTHIALKLTHAPNGLFSASACSCDIVLRLRNKETRGRTDE